MDHERFASSSGGRKAHRIESGYYVQGKTIYYTGSAVENSCYILKQGIPKCNYSVLELTLPDLLKYLHL